MRLSVNVLPGLELSDPLMIASSHWTGTENALKRLAAVKPSAVTLKTTAPSKGGDGKTSLSERKRTSLCDSEGNEFASFTDGPPTLELLDIAATLALTRAAKQLLPDSALGLSVLQGEDYSDVARSLPLGDYAYVELNLKYTFRKIRLESLSDFLKTFLADLDSFLVAFSQLPILVKLSRETCHFAKLADFRAFFERLDSAHAGMVVANSLRIRVPPSRTPSETGELQSGVVVGEHLYLDTYDTIREFMLTPIARVLPTVASGGLDDVGGIVDMVAAGARAVQLCSALDRRGLQVLALLRWQLEEICGYGVSFEELRHELCTSGERWPRAVSAARDLRIQERQPIDRLFARENRIIDWTASTLAEECSQPPDIQVTASLGHIEGDLKCVLGYGNALSCLLIHLFTEEYQLAPIVLSEVSRFLARLKEPAFDWDVAILASSHLEYLNRQRTAQLAAGIPQKVVEIGQSRWKLMGARGLHLGNIKTVFHFGGPSARYALNSLLEACQPTPQQIGASQLLPLLRFWDVENAILAKAPLCYAYGELCPTQVATSWEVLWSVADPLWLVGNTKRLGSSKGREMIEGVAGKIADKRAFILQDTKRAARRLTSAWFYRYCLQLLEPDRRRPNP